MCVELGSFSRIAAAYGAISDESPDFATYMDVA